MQPALVGTRGGDRAAVAQLADAMQRVAELRLDDGTQILACVPGERLVSELGPRHAVAQLAVIDTQHVFAPEPGAARRGVAVGVRVRQGVVDPQRKIGDTQFVVPRLCQGRSEEHTSELQSLMRISYAVFCLKKKN